MKEYVVGIIFDKEEAYTLLIRKNRPEWQVGMLNGIGGHIEANETPYEAMVRECKEECNLDINNWLLLGATTDVDNWKVHFFSANVSNFEGATSVTDEIVEIIKLNAVDYEQVVSPTDVFIRLALNPRFKAIAMEAR